MKLHLTAILRAVTTETNWLNATELEAWLAWLRLTSEIPRVLHRQLVEDAGITLQDYDVLVQLSESITPTMRVSTLARAIHWERSRLSHHLKKMVQRELITMNACPNDARAIDVALTPLGRSTLERSAPGHAAAVRSLVFGALSEDDVDSLRRITTTMLAGIQPA